MNVRRGGRLRALAAAIALLLLLTPTAAAAPAPAGSARFGSRIDFHGWSKSSDYIAYTRTRHRPGEGRRAAPVDEVQRMHRRVAEGRFAGFGKMVGGDVASWALEHGYVVDPAPRTRVDPRTTVFRVAGWEYTLRLLVGRRVGWELLRGDELVTRRFFDSIYLDYAAELFIAPDASQAVLVMHLDGGWVVDAAVYPIELRRGTPRSAP